jgi:hypothetical protein
MMDIPEGKRFYAIAKGRWPCNIKIILIKLGNEFMDWIRMASGQSPLSGVCENCDKLKKSKG